MADSIDFDTSELFNLAVDFPASSARAVFKGSQLVRASAQRVVAHAQQFVPVDTSATKGSIHASTPDGGTLGALESGALGRGVIEAEIGPTTEYAPDLEYGTVKMAPHAFMGPALDKVTPDFVAGAAEIAETLW